MKGQVLRSSLADELASLFEDEEIVVFPDEEVIDEETLSGWIQLHMRHPRLPTEPYRFHYLPQGATHRLDYSYLKAVVDDPSEHLVIRKAAQMGLSDIMVRDCLARVCSHQGTTALYVLPTKDQVIEFSDRRVKPIIESSPYLSRMVSGTNNTQRVKLGNSWIVVRGGHHYRQAQEVDAAFLYLDEFDRIKQNLIPSFEQRVTGSIHKHKRYFGTPQDADLGIDRLYQKSDMKMWFDICAGCGHEQVVGEENLRQVQGETDWDYMYACVSCGRELVQHERTGVWKPTAQKPETSMSGYWISQFACPTVSPKEMAEAKVKILIREDYYNLKLGIGAKKGLDEEGVVDPVFGDHIADPHCPVDTDGQGIMAIDWGMPWSWAEISVRIPGTQSRKVLWVEAFESRVPSEHSLRMIALANNYRVGYIVADLGWGHHQAETVAKSFPNKFWTVMTNTDRFKPAFYVREKRIVWSKIRSVKSHFGMLRQRRVILPNASPRIRYEGSTYAAHMLWVLHHQNTKTVIVRNDNVDREQEMGGAVDVKEEIKSTGIGIHLAMVSSYADIFFQYLLKSKDVEETRRRLRSTVRVATIGGRR